MVGNGRRRGGWREQSALRSTHSRQAQCVPTWTLNHDPVAHQFPPFAKNLCHMNYFLFFLNGEGSPLTTSPVQWQRSKRRKPRGVVPWRLRAPLRHCSCSARGARHAPARTMKVRPLPLFFFFARPPPPCPRGAARTWRDVVAYCHRAPRWTADSATRRTSRSLYLYDALCLCARGPTQPRRKPNVLRSVCARSLPRAPPAIAPRARMCRFITATCAAPACGRPIALAGAHEKDAPAFPRSAACAAGR